MRLATLRTADGGTVAAARRGDGPWRRLPAPDVGAFLAARAGRPAPDGLEELDEFDELDEPAEEGFAPVIPHPAKVICCGHNYRAHILELGHDIPRHPTLFTKFADTLTGAYADVELPPEAGQIDWEAELAVVVGAPLHRAGREEAQRAIAGWTAANDISVRDWQRHTAQWLPGKAFDRTTPLGPWLVTADAVDPAAGLRVSCAVNGVTMQDATTADLVFDSADLLAYISRFTRLRPGDVVLTGTPGGVGIARNPPVLLDDGDIVETAIEELGTLRNRVRRTR